jgi:hypothetical protein
MLTNPCCSVGCIQVIVKGIPTVNRAIINDQGKGTSNRLIDRSQLGVQI